MIPEYALGLVRDTRITHNVGAEFSDQRIYDTILEIESVPYKNARARRTAYIERFNTMSNTKKVLGTTS